MDFMDCDKEEKMNIILYDFELQNLLKNGHGQIRRAMKSPPLWIAEPNVPFKTEDCNPKGIIKCPFGAVGEEIWCKETWARLLAVSPATDKPNEWGDRFYKEIESPTKQPNGLWNYDGTHIIYAADGGIEWCDGNGFMDFRQNGTPASHWKSPVTMPREASRMIIIPERIWWEPLQKIDWAGMKAEGFEAIEQFEGCFSQVWDSHTKPSYKFADNPIVWCGEVRVK
jgi:hypothetical protein